MMTLEKEVQHSIRQVQGSLCKQRNPIYLQTKKFNMRIDRRMRNCRFVHNASPVLLASRTLQLWYMMK